MRHGCFIGLMACLLLACQDRSDRYYTGYVEGENSYMMSPYAGHLLKLMVQKGSQVKKGQLLFILASTPESFDKDSAEYSWAAAKATEEDLKRPRRPPEIQSIEDQIANVDANIALAALRLQRTQTLYAKKVIEKDALDAAVARLDSQKANKAMYEAQLALAKLGSREGMIENAKAQASASHARYDSAAWRVQQKKVYAPKAGRIVDIYYHVGEWVPAQQSVLSLLTPDYTYIAFFVPVGTLQHLHWGQTIEAQCMGCSGWQKATISAIFPQAEFVPPLVYSRDNEDHLVFRIEATLPADTPLKPGQPVMVNIPWH